MLESCSDYCGYVAAIIGALAFGSFGVPIKYVSNLNVDPLVMQTYKSVVCFLTCWLVVFLGEPIKFTYWGIISGLFWVPGATAGIVGIRQAGLAISVGMWSSLNVISSFCWGLGVFHERVKSVHGSLNAAFILILGLMGMAYYSAPVKESHQVDKHDDEELKKPLVSNSLSLLDDSINGSEDFDQLINSNIFSSSATEQSSDIELTSLDKVTPSISAIAPETKAPVKITRRKKTDGMEGVEVQTFDDKQVVKDYEFVVFSSKFKMTKRQVGLVGAAINGIWGSNSLIPLHYARKQGFHGAGYLISYSVGSMIVTILLWSLRYLYHYFISGRDAMKAWNAIPSFHIREMWLQGLLSGLLYSLGNVCSILAISSLGQGVGFSFIQSSMLISGLWGVCFFREIRGLDRIMKWLLSSIATIIGILLLSHQHIGNLVHR